MVDGFGYVGLLFILGLIKMLLIIVDGVRVVWVDVDIIIVDSLCNVKGDLVMIIVVDIKLVIVFLGVIFIGDVILCVIVERVIVVLKVNKF